MSFLSNPLLAGVLNFADPVTEQQSPHVCTIFCSHKSYINLLLILLYMCICVIDVYTIPETLISSMYMHTLLQTWICVFLKCRIHPQKNTGA